jgi:murein L,D-transpeptidase YcbB/YkuD
MVRRSSSPLPLRFLCAALAALFLPLGAAPAAQAQSMAYQQAVAEAAAEDAVIAAFYLQNGYPSIWTEADDAPRRAALLRALTHASYHALPVARYDAAGLVAALESARSDGDRGRAEVAMTRAFLAYAHDVQSGALNPARVDPAILRDVHARDLRAQLDGFLAADPAAYLRALPPGSPEYARLMAEKIALENLIAQGGWGPTVGVEALKPGQSGPDVVALRDRLVRMGFLRQTASQDYDVALLQAVRSFQYRFGLSPDSVAGPRTIEELNRPAEDRLKSVIVALERERWMNIDRGARHIWVNLADFSAQIVDHGRTTFQTRTVIGKNTAYQRSPEFSDVMEFMVINPSWHVPRSILTREYLPLMQEDPQAASHLTIIDQSGQAVPREAIDFTAYTAATFPFAMRQPPSDGNALGKVKFMFPNPHNIYLHDTPHKDLFARQVRAYSHGCIRLADPFDFAYTLLAPQSADPRGEFASHLRTGVESVINLKVPVPVHLVYFTAYPDARGEMTYRPDVYGRDARIFEALEEAGVTVGSVQG